MSARSPARHGDLHDVQPVTAFRIIDGANAAVPE